MKVFGTQRNSEKWLGMFIIACGLLLLSSIFFNVQLSNDEEAYASYLLRPECNRTIRLRNFTTKDSEPMQVFFLETSGNSYLRGRQVGNFSSNSLQFIALTHPQKWEGKKELRKQFIESQLLENWQLMLYSIHTFRLPLPTHASPYTKLVHSAPLQFASHK